MGVWVVRQAGNGPSSHHQHRIKFRLKSHSHFVISSLKHNQPHQPHVTWHAYWNLCCHSTHTRTFKRMALLWYISIDMYVYMHARGGTWIHWNHSAPHSSNGTGTDQKELFEQWEYVISELNRNLWSCGEQKQILYVSTWEIHLVRPFSTISPFEWSLAINEGIVGVAVQYQRIILVTQAATSCFWAFPRVHNDNNNDDDENNTCRNNSIVILWRVPFSCLISVGWLGTIQSPVRHPHHSLRLNLLLSFSRFRLLCSWTERGELGREKMWRMLRDDVSQLRRRKSNLLFNFQ